MEIENFNKQYKMLLEDLQNGYPDIRIEILDSPKNEYLNHFIINVLPYIDNISVKNFDYFKYKCKNKELVKNLKYKYIFDLDIRENISIIWKYLQNLYINLNNINNIKKYLDNFKEDENYRLMVLSMDKNNYDTYVENFLKVENRIKPKKKKKKKKRRKEKKQVYKDPVITSDEEEDNSMFPNLDNLDTDFIENSTIGKLAKEISSEIDPSKFENMNNPSELFGSLFGGNTEEDGDNKTKETFGNLMKTVCSKLDNKFKSGDIKQDDLFKEAQQMMGGLNLFDPGMISKMMQGNGGMPGMPGMKNPRAREMKRKLNKKFNEKNNKN
jgi:hypothetical protein